MGSCCSCSPRSGQPTEPPHPRNPHHLLLLLPAARRHPGSCCCCAASFTALPPCPLGVGTETAPAPLWQRDTGAFRRRRIRPGSSVGAVPSARAARRIRPQPVGCAEALRRAVRCSRSVGGSQRGFQRIGKGADEVLRLLAYAPVSGFESLGSRDVPLDPGAWICNLNPAVSPRIQSCITSWSRLPAA